MNLTFTQAARGVDKDLFVTMNDTCSRCRGTGGEPGSSPVICNQCNGSGMVGTATMYHVYGVCPFLWAWGNDCNVCAGNYQHWSLRHAVDVQTLWRATENYSWQVPSLFGCWWNDTQQDYHSSCAGRSEFPHASCLLWSVCRALLIVYV